MHCPVCNLATCEGKYSVVLGSNVADVNAVNQIMFIHLRTSFNVVQPNWFSCRINVLSAREALSNCCRVPRMCRIEIMSGNYYCRFDNFLHFIRNHGSA
jgi:hypothetical protein